MLKLVGKMHAASAKVEVGRYYEGVDKIAKFKCALIVSSSDSNLGLSKTACIVQANLS